METTDRTAILVVTHLTILRRYFGWQKRWESQVVAEAAAPLLKVRAVGNFRGGDPMVTSPQTPGRARVAREARAVTPLRASAATTGLDQGVRASVDLPEGSRRLMLDLLQQSRRSRRSPFLHGV